MGTIPGGGGSVITFSVSGNASGNYAADFAGAVANAPVSTLPNESTVAGALNVFNSGDSINTILTTAQQYTYISTGASSFVTLAASQETLLVGALVTVSELGAVGGERVTFTDGDNQFIGSTDGAGEDTITAGSGNDTIQTGGGSSTVFSGTGNALIYLNDTSAGHGDIAVLDSGNSTVYADGVADTVFASAAGIVVGGTGSLLLTTDGGTVTVLGGTGAVTGFLTSGSDFTFFNSAGGSIADFNAGAGNETLDGAGAAGGFAFFADTASGDSGTVVDSVTGGSGYDYFSTGTGTEDYTAGSGNALFEIASVAGASITINDFGAGDSVNFFGDNVATETSFLSTSGTATGGNYVVTLSDSSTVTFVGVSSLTGHLS